jgi:outer membrane autotransporter protein
MTVSNRNTSAKLSRIARSMKPTKTAAAIRAGLLATTAMLSLAGSGMAFAQSCTTVANVATCSGDFTDTLDTTYFTDAANLTVILDSGSTINPADFDYGIEASWTGLLTLTVEADTEINTYGADGVHVYAQGTGGNVSIGGDVYTYSDGDNDDNAVYVWAWDDLNLDISGSASVYSYNYDVTAVYAYSWDDVTDVTVAEGGSVDAHSYNGDALGIYAYGYGSTVTNSGDVSATSDYGYALGVYVSDGNGDGANLYNHGDIDVNGYYGAYGAYVFSDGGDAYAFNDGSISAVSHYYYGNANALGLYVSGDNATVVNAGDIYAASGTGYYYGLFSSAVGVYANGAVDASITNSGSIGAYSGGFVGVAIGADVYAFSGTASITNTADGSIDGTTGGPYGYAYGVIVNGVDAELNNYGEITAYSHGFAGTATAAFVYGITSASVYNDGVIAGVADGYYGTARGLYVYSATDADIENFGEISAYAPYGYATAIYTYVAGNSTIYNAGTISAYSYYYDSESYAIYSAGGSYDTVINQGTIDGSIWLNDGDDSLYNGVDGTIVLSDGQFIDMGTYNVAPNVVQNYGVINFTGDVSIYNIGGYVLNDGSLDSMNSQGDDNLYIYSDFAGTGELNVDVEGGYSYDTLYINGSVAADSVTTVNVDLVQLPVDDFTEYTLVSVTGDSVAGNFVLGDVIFSDANFLDLDFTWTADIDPTNVDLDTWTLGIEVVGLSDPGTLAASVPMSNMNLVNNLVGTWRQRMGVIESFTNHGVSLWARVFHSNGDFSPDHLNVGFGQGGNFDYEQKNTGAEAGIDFALSEHFAFGALISRSESDVDLRDGVGSNDIEADGYGLYATWISPNHWYLDVSYRWNDIENRLDSAVGNGLRIDAEAEALNFEAGYTFTFASGLKFEPQIQYTHVDWTVDDSNDTLNGDISNFTLHDGESARVRVGVSVRQSFGDAETGWEWTPYGTLSAVRELDGDARFVINNNFSGWTSHDGTSAMLELGFNARHENLAIYGGLTWQDGGAIDSMFGGHLGIRYTFGGAAPAPVVVAPPPAKTCAELDDDGDGVNNCDDRCPGSPAGSAVGADGCPVPAPTPEPEPVMEPKPYRG